jgi:hypothetical protein
VSQKTGLYDWLVRGYRSGVYGTNTSERRHFAYTPGS